ncbi:hypothetical protein P885DRAFT_41668 [Corynascus similis CBS 632.67]
MRHNTLFSSALRANSLSLSRPRAPTCTLPLNLLIKELSAAPPPTSPPLQRRNHTSISPNQRRQHNVDAETEAASIATTITTPNHYDLAPSAANPPPTTRPPPLDLPSKPDPAPPILSRPGFSHLFATGVAYLKFYKAALRQVIFTNTRLLYPSSSSTSTTSSTAATEKGKQDKDYTPPPMPGTRAHLHLRLRWQHDVRRLPLFALILLVCGELTPLVVLALPRAVPLACRIPRQVEGLLRASEARRAEGRAQAQAQVGNKSVGNGQGKGEPVEKEVPVEVMAKVLGLPVRAWTPAFVLRSRVLRRLRFLDVDDALLIRAGGAAALVEDELRLACADRGINVLGRGEAELREALRKWLRLTDADRLGEEGRERAVRRLLLLRDSEWEDEGI